MRYLIIFFIAMLPLAELRIAIPTGLYRLYKRILSV